MELDCSYLAAQHGIKCRKTGTYSPQRTEFIERAIAEVEHGCLTLTPPNLNPVLGVVFMYTLMGVITM